MLMINQDEEEKGGAGGRLRNLVFKVPISWLRAEVLFGLGWLGVHDSGFLAQTWLHASEVDLRGSGPGFERAT